MEDILSRWGNPSRVFEQNGIKHGPFMQAMEELVRREDLARWSNAGGSNDSKQFESGLVNPDQRLNNAASYNINLDNVASKMMQQMGRMDPQLGQRGKPMRTDKTQEGEVEGSVLEKFGIDFAKKAEEGKLCPVVGRDEEIRRAIQILSRWAKNDPVLIGDPGLGKSTIAEGVAQRMLAGDVPDDLKPPRRLVGLAIFF